MSEDSNNANNGGPSRREFFRRVGVGVPLLTQLGMGMPAQAEAPAPTLRIGRRSQRRILGVSFLPSTACTRTGMK